MTRRTTDGTWRVRRVSRKGEPEGEPPRYLFVYWLDPVSRDDLQYEEQPGEANATPFPSEGAARRYAGFARDVLGGEWTVEFEPAFGARPGFIPNTDR